jgi:DNA polymerase elongation subunit (family B)
MKKKIVMDIEVYSNYALFSFADLNLTKFIELELFEGQLLNTNKLKAILNKYQIITFNGRNYDIPVTLAALSGFTNANLKLLSDDIIKSGRPGWQTLNVLDLREPARLDHIDIKEPAPGVMISLKLYGGRLSSKWLRDLPIEPSATISPEQREELRIYCRNDLTTTAELYKAVEHEIELRAEMGKTYQTDLRSLSGAQVAKAVFKKLLQDKRVNVHTPELTASQQTFQYNMPKWINFKTPELQALKEAVTNAWFNVNDKGSVLIPDELKKAITFDGAKYKIGIGGLHSQEKKQAVIADSEHLLFEKDVASMYPSMILGQRLYPKHLTKKFVSIYADMVKRRLDAKHKGDKATANSLKLVINSSFGLFGNKYSFLYSPDLLIQTTITGQLCLLMLIESLSLIGAKTVSANTDGVNVLCHKDIYDKVNHECFMWEITTGMELEENRYLATYNESVNSYIAIQADGAVKSKGNYALPGLMKNTVNSICIEAVIAYLSESAPIEQTVNASNDIAKFLTVRTVKGGGVQGDQYLGKVVRWYYGNNSEHTINYKTNGNKVPKSDGAVPCMDLPDKFPADLNRQWYIDESKKMLELLGL